MKFLKYILIYFLFILIMFYKVNANTDISISGANAIILVDMKFDKILYKEKIYRKCYPASTTKIMTALLALEYLNLNDYITITETMIKCSDNINTSITGFKLGEKIKVIDLLYYLLLTSSNEASNILAISISKNIPTFARLMNARAIQLGCKNTQFTNPSGLHNNMHYTTAYDLYLITKQAMKNKNFRRIVRTSQKKIPVTNLNKNIKKIHTTNMLILRKDDPLYFEHCIGIKTGYTKMAKHCFVSMAVYRRCHLISVVLGMDNDIDKNNTTFTITKKLFEWALENYYYKVFIIKRNLTLAIPIRYSSLYNQNLITLLSQETMHTIVSNDIFNNDLIEIWDIHPRPNYNIKKGQIIGQFVLKSHDDIILGHNILIASEDIKISKFLYSVESIKNISHVIYKKFTIFIYLFFLLMIFFI